MIDYSRDDLLEDYSQRLLNEYYVHDNECIQEAFMRASKAFADDDAHAQRLYESVSQLHFMFATPVLANAGSKRGMPISCFLSYVPDTLEGLIAHTSELRWLSVKGGGVAGHWSDIRSVSDIAPSPIPFLHTVDADIIAYKQGKTRRASYAAYMDIGHPDILEFVGMRTPTGDSQRKCFNIHHAVNIPDIFMERVRDNEHWYLIDPNDGTVRDTVSARSLWQKLLETRMRTGEPYMCFIDTANRALNDDLRKRGLRINGSNLCTEIMLPTTEERTAVCCLSSLNLAKYDEWPDTLIDDLVRMLDNVLSYFIKHCPDSMSKARYSAKLERSIGLGVMGFHDHLQQREIPFDGPIAIGVNRKLFEEIHEKSIRASVDLGSERGVFPDAVNSKQRHSHVLAIAPNANSAIIAGTSPGIEPWAANVYTHKARTGSFVVRNPNINVRKHNKGSIQEFDEYTDWEKKVFKTAYEIDQRWIIQHAADRQEFICQGQSVNLFFPADTDKGYVNEVHRMAWKEGLKSLYYLRSMAGVTVERTSDECFTCGG